VPPAKPLIEQIETIANQLRMELFSGVDEADLGVHAGACQDSGNLEKS
jgi:MarR family transcriptional regulator for hemolysin